MRTKAVRLYGKNDLRVDEFILPEPRAGELLVEIVSDSVCMSTYKAAVRGPEHKRVPEDISENPIIVGHEFSGRIIGVGEDLKGTYSKDQKFAIQPNINHKGIGYAPGYSFPHFGGDATYNIIPAEVMEKGFLLPYSGDAFFKASLAEPMSCIVSAFKSFYHNEKGGKEHKMGIVEGGNMAILAGVGPMGLGAVDFALHNDRKPGKLVVTDINQERLDHAEKLLTLEDAASHGVELIYVNTSDIEDPAAYLLGLTENEGFDDVFSFAPVQQVVETADRILGNDGCLNFFAGPTDTEFSALINFYQVHYNGSHIVGTSGGDTEDMLESLQLMSIGALNPAVMVTHIGGLESAVDTTLNLPNIPGGKKLIYPHITMGLTAIADFRKLGEQDPLFKGLADITDKHHGIWSAEAEKFLLSGGV